MLFTFIPDLPAEPPPVSSTPFAEVEAVVPVVAEAVPAPSDESVMFVFDSLFLCERM